MPHHWRPIQCLRLGTTKPPALYQCLAQNLNMIPFLVDQLARYPHRLHQGWRTGHARQRAQRVFTVERPADLIGVLAVAADVAMLAHGTAR